MRGDTMGQQHKRNALMQKRELCALLCSLLLLLSACDERRGGSATGSSAPEMPSAEVATPEGEPESPTGPPPAIEESEHTLSFQRLPAERTNRQVRLLYRRLPDQPRARAAELYLKLGAGLRYRSSEAGEVLRTGGKELIVQEKSPELLRVIIFARGNLTPFTDGVLLNLSFEETGSGAEQIELLQERPLFAPIEANQSLRLPERFDFEGGQR